MDHILFLVRKMKLGIIHTSSNNAEKILEIAYERYPEIKVINFVDEALWELVVEAKGKMTQRCNEILTEDFKRLEEAGCDGVGLLCSLVKEGMDTVRKNANVPSVVYDDVAVEKAVELSDDGDTIAIIAMKEPPLPIAALACEKAIQKSGKDIKIQQIVVEEAAKCPDPELADQCFIQYLENHQEKYSAYVIPQVPLSRLMPSLRNMETPVFDSMETLLDGLVERVNSNH